MNQKKGFITLAAGIVVGMVLAPASAQAVSDYLTATRSTQPIYVDGRQVQMEAYSINGSNYVKLRDIGQTVGFNVYWQPNDSTIQIETDKPYTGEAPSSTSSAQNTSVQSTSAVTTLTTDIEALRQEIIDRTNALRVENGVRQVKADPMMMRAAQVRADEMAATGIYSHSRPDGSSCRSVTNCPHNSENIHRFGCQFIEDYGVNAAEFAVRGWRFSERHLRNMLQENVAKIGVGIARGYDDFGQEAWYCVQWFMRDGYTITWVDAPQIPG